MCDQESLRPACTYSMSVKLLIEHHLEFLSLKEAAQASLGQHLAKHHFVGNRFATLLEITCYGSYICLLQALAIRVPLQGSLFIMLFLGSIGINRVINEFCYFYKGIIGK